MTTPTRPSTAERAQHLYENGLDGQAGKTFVEHLTAEIDAAVREAVEAEQEQLAEATLKLIALGCNKGLVAVARLFGLQNDPCPDCEGKGYRFPHGFTNCPDCHGTGTLPWTPESLREAIVERVREIVQREYDHNGTSAITNALRALLLREGEGS